MNHKLGELTVADYMTAGAIVVNDTDKLTSAIRTMTEHEIKVLPVVNMDGKVIGILSSTDLLEITHEIQADLGSLQYVSEKTQDFLIQMLVDQGDNTYVRDVMTSPVDTIAPDSNLVVAARLLVENRYHHVPVVDQTDQPIGVLSTSDFVRAFAEHGPMLAG